MKHYLCRGVLALIILIIAGTAAQADIVIRLKDGRTFSLPVTPDQVDTITFGDVSAHKTRQKAMPASPSAQKFPLRDGHRVLTVGPDQALKVPSAAAKAAEDGDIIEIEAGDYVGDVAIWRQNNLTIRGTGGRPHIDAGGKNAGGKAIWVIKGANTIVENIEFSGSRVRDLNGAGIRQEGAGLTVENCYFHNNQIGLISGANMSSDIVIRKSEFADNALDPGQKQNPGHNIYIGKVRSFTLTNSYIHGAHTGHNVKSRAARNIISKNRIEDGKSGSSSYLLDLPAGGVVMISDNYFQQGSKTENSTLISYGAEKVLHAANDLTVTGNTFVNNNWNGIFVNNHTDVDAKVRMNRFKGTGQILHGKGTASDNQIIRQGE